MHEPSLGPTSSLSGVFSSHSDLEILLSTWALRLSPKDTSPSPVLVPHCPDLPRTAAWVSVRTKLILSSGHLLRQTLLQWHTQQPSAEAAMWTPCHAAGAPGYVGLASLTMHSSFEEPTSAHCEHRVVPCPHQYFFNLCLQFPQGIFYCSKGVWERTQRPTQARSQSTTAFNPGTQEGSLETSFLTSSSWNSYHLSSSVPLQMLHLYLPRFQHRESFSTEEAFSVARVWECLAGLGLSACCATDLSMSSLA